LAAYRALHTTGPVEARLEALEAEHTALMDRYADLLTPRAKEKAAANLKALEDRIAALEAHRGDLAEVVEGYHEQVRALRATIGEARRTRHDPGPARAAALRNLLAKIKCSFVTTGYQGPPAPGKPRSRPLEIWFVAVGQDEDEAPSYRLERSYAGP
jgi:hypothetical protein